MIGPDSQDCIEDENVARPEPVDIPVLPVPDQKIAKNQGRLQPKGSKISKNMKPQKKQ